MSALRETAKIGSMVGSADRFVGVNEMLIPDAPMRLDGKTQLEVPGSSIRLADPIGRSLSIQAVQLE